MHDIAGEMIDLFRDANQRQRLELCGLLLGLFGCVLVFAVLVGRAIPVKERIVGRVINRTVKERVLVPGAPDTKYPSLKDPRSACKGAPVIIVRMDVSTPQGGDKDKVNTWMTVRPVGDSYTVQCFMSGDYSSLWKVGEIASLNGDRSG